MSGIGPSSTKSSADQSQTTTSVGASDQGAAATSGAAASGGSSVNTGVINQNLDTQFAHDVLDYQNKTITTIANTVANQANASLSSLGSSLTAGYSTLGSLAQGTQTNGLSNFTTPALWIGGGIAALLIIMLLRKR